jgi:hypothetical protein
VEGQRAAAGAGKARVFKGVGGGGAWVSVLVAKPMIIHTIEG